MVVIFDFLQIVAAFIVRGALAVAFTVFLLWQVKRLIDGKFSMFTILRHVLCFLGIFLLEVLFGVIDEALSSNSSSSGDSGKYLDTASALSMGVDLQDVYEYNMGNPMTKHKLRDIEPYIQKTKYF